MLQLLFPYLHYISNVQATCGISASETPGQAATHLGSRQARKAASKAVVKVAYKRSSPDGAAVEVMPHSDSDSHEGDARGGDGSSKALPDSLVYKPRFVLPPSEPSTPTSRSAPFAANKTAAIATASSSTQMAASMAEFVALQKAEAERKTSGLYHVLFLRHDVYV